MIGLVAGFCFGFFFGCAFEVWPGLRTGIPVCGVAWQLIQDVAGRLGVRLSTDLGS